MIHRKSWMLKKQSDQLRSKNFRQLFFVRKGYGLRYTSGFQGRWCFEVDGICNIPVWNLFFFSAATFFFFEAGWMLFCFPYIPTCAGQDKCASIIHARCFTKPCVCTSYCPILTNFVLVRFSPQIIP